MLKLAEIKKDYVLNGGDTVPALKGVNLEFRQSEFVSILGPSGCGKTTLLNIIGGLDRYTDGDMSIDGISTMHYSDVDWDAYRNIRIGFIFQSYNLITHIDILTNVEMALLLSGVSKSERRARAIKALEEVGLGEHIHKKPNQLSGGQMQRVSIARALINNPSIILADEPTGALDSTTSLQIMEILKEISYNKLIIMVTHNPELAYEYSNRIVRLKDGEVVDDTNPYHSETVYNQSADEETQIVQDNNQETESSGVDKDDAADQADDIGQNLALEEVTCEGDGKLQETTKKKPKIEFAKHKAKKHRKMMLKKTSMSFASAIKLSFTNLMTKKGRTFMTAFAGSIGIIGVALVLAISNGFSGYVNNMQKTMLSGYPVTITSNATSMESMMGTYMSFMNSGKTKYPTEDKVYSYNLADLFKTMIHENKLDKNYIDYFDAKKAVWEKEGYVDSVYYNYGYTYNVYNKNGDNVGKAVGTDMKTVNWQEMVGDRAYMENNFDIIGGKFPEQATDLVLIVDNTNSLLSVYLNGMGFGKGLDIGGINTGALTAMDQDFDKIIGNTDPDKGKLREPVTFIVPNNDAKYFRTNNAETGKDYYAVRNYKDIKALSEEQGAYRCKVVGILRPKEGKEYSPVMQGIAYTQQLTDLMRKDAKNSEIVKFQNSIDYNSLTGKEFDKSSFNLDFSNIDNIMNIINGGSTAMTSKVVAQMIGASDIPSSISIYDRSFDNKAFVLDDLDAWNKTHSKQEIKYTDSAAVIIGMMNQIIRIITIALVCFSSVSLVVSSIMIGIITYVSVVERTKEIGILRSLGARKRDVSNIFNAETVIIGFTAGLIGVLVTYLLSIPINLVITYIEATITGICILNPLHAILLILLSIALTSIAGLVPARIAAKRDPVVALRTE